MIIYKGHFYRTAKDLSDYIGKTWESPEGTRSVVSIMNPPSRLPMLAVKTEGLGGSQLYTLDDLEFEIKRDTKNLEYRTKIERERTNREVEEQKEREFLDQYLATISSPKTRGKASAILMRPATINGESDLT